MAAQSNLRILFAFQAFVLACSVVSAQTTATESVLPSPSVPTTTALPLSTCNPWIIQTLPTELSFRQRFCLGLAQIASPATLAKSVGLAAYSQWRDSPKIKPRDSDDFGVRLNHIYERQTARVTAELFVGYLHHEDPRPHFSNKQGPWHRTGASLLSVIARPDQNGNTQIQLAPLAGALGSGLTSMALYQQQTSLVYGLQRSGFVYSGYFARALLHEFSPQLWLLAPPFIRKHQATLHKAFTL